MSGKAQSSDTVVWRLRGPGYSLVGEVCNECGAKLFPPRDVCPECKNGIPEVRKGQTENFLSERENSLPPKHRLLIRRERGI